MPLENVSNTSTEQVKINSKGFARQAINLVNQVLLDGIQQIADFSDFLALSSSPKVAVVQRPEQAGKTSDEKVHEPEIEVTVAEQHEPQSSPVRARPHKAFDNCMVISESADSAPQDSPEENEVGCSEQVAVPVADSGNAEPEETVPENPQVSEEQQASPVLTEQVAAELVSTQLLQEIGDDQESSTPLQSSVATPASEADTQKPDQQLLQSVEIPDEIKNQISNLKQGDLRKAVVAEKAVVSGQNEAVSEALPQQTPMANQSVELQQKVPLEVVEQQLPPAANIADKNPNFVQARAVISNTGLQVAAMAVAAETEQHQALNAESVLATKLQNNINKTNSDFTLTSSQSLKSGSPTSSAQGNALALGLNLNMGENGQKSDFAKNLKPLTRIQSLSTLEKVDAVLQKVAESKDGSTISLRLDPPSLGSLRADVSFKDGILHARLFADNAQVLQLLREKASDLQLTLRKMGLEVDKVSVSVSSGDQGGFEGDLQDREGKSERGNGKFFSSQADFAELTDRTVLDHWIA